MRGTLPIYIILLTMVFPLCAYGLGDDGHLEETPFLIASASPFVIVMSEAFPKHQVTLEDVVRIQILTELEAMEDGSAMSLIDGPVHARNELISFYRKRDFRAAWLSSPGLTSDAFKLLKVLHDSPNEGLDPRDYHMGQLRAMMSEVVRTWQRKRPPRPLLWARMDMLLTDAFFTYTIHRHQGRVGNPDVGPVWPGRAGLAETLELALKSGTLDKVLNMLPPPHNGYARLRDAMAQYQRLASEGGWRPIAGGPSLRKGDKGERVRALRQRLEVTGELNGPGKSKGNKFDAKLENAVRLFQRSHGLQADGVVGQSTLDELNVPVEERMAQLAVNLERWRWMPEELGERYIMVNIAGFELDVVEKGKTVMSMEAIVGNDYAQTPVFSGLMTYLVLGPSWTVPRTIAVEKKLPLILKDPTYLSRHGYQVIRRNGDDIDEIDPSIVDWSKLNEDYFPYQLRQEPGPGNALGLVKFIFPNPFDVYIHDTPERWLFKRNKRTYSAGCIRISEPITLAEYLLDDPVKWNRKVIIKAIGKWKGKKVKLPRKIPTYISYFTSWVDDDGVLQFREDIYGRDKGILNGMIQNEEGYLSSHGYIQQATSKKAAH